MKLNTEQVPKPSNADADPVRGWGRLPSPCVKRAHEQGESAGAVVTACWQKESCGNTGSPAGREPQGDPPDLREGETGPNGKSERLIVPKNPGNAGGGKEPQFKGSARRSDGREIGESLANSRKRSGTSGGTACPSEGGCGSSAPHSVRKPFATILRGRKRENPCPKAGCGKTARPV